MTRHPRIVISVAFLALTGCMQSARVAPTPSPIPAGTSPRAAILGREPTDDDCFVNAFDLVQIPDAPTLARHVITVARRPAWLPTRRLPGHSRTARGRRERTAHPERSRRPPGCWCPGGAPPRRPLLPARRAHGRARLVPGRVRLGVCLTTDTPPQYQVMLRCTRHERLQAGLPGHLDDRRRWRGRDRDRRRPPARRARRDRHGRRSQPQSRDHHRQRAGGPHRGHLRGARQPGADRHRRVRARRSADDHQRGGELPRLPGGHPGARS